MKSLVNCVFKEKEKLRVGLSILFPLRVFKFFTQPYDILKELLSEVLANFVLDPHWNKVKLRIDIHGQGDLSLSTAQRLIPKDEIFVLQLNIIRINLAFVSQFLFQVRTVMNGTSEKEKSVVLVKTVVTDSLEKSLSDRDNWNMIFSESDSAVSVHDLFLPRNLHEWHELFVKVHFNAKADENLKRLFNNRFHEDSYSPVFPSCADSDSFSIRFLNPSSPEDLILVLDDLAVLFSDLIQDFFLLFQLIFKLK